MSDLLHLGTRKGLFTVTKSAAGWKITKADFLGTQVPIFLADKRSGMLHAAVDHGHFGTKMHRSNDNGATWEELPPPAWPEKPADAVEVKDPWRGVAVPWSLEKVWCLETGGSDESDVLWAGTIPGGLFRSLDSGASWELVRSLWDRPERSRWFGGGYDFPGIHSICVDPRNSRRVLLGISCGGAWRTEDGGQTWMQTAHGMRAAFTPPDSAFDPEIQDPHRIVRCESSPDILWTQHHNGIFRSGDDGKTWQEITTALPSNFGFAVAVQPQNPDIAWFVPAVKDEMRIPVDGRLVVSRTVDGGRSFETLISGLPQEHAYHLVYRHCLDVSSCGRRLAMGSTTGGLWLSEDAGESWSCVSRDLPPVFCVRFAP